jgi:hypothetical protein
MLGVDAVGSANSERAAGANGDSPDVDCGLLAVGHLGPHRVTCRTAATPSKRPASRKGFVDLPPAMGEFKQAENLRGFVCVLVSNDGNAGDPTAGIELDPDRLNLASDPVLQVNRERVAAMHNRTAASEKQASPFLRTRHQRFLALVQIKDCQLLYSEEAFTGLVTLPLRTVSPRECCRPAFEQDPFRAYPRLVCCLAFERSELRKHSDVGLEPVCNVVWAVVPNLPW